MIEQIYIQNFQSHEKTELTLHEGVNVIVGSSDTGKSAIVRALRWVIWNRPSGNDICSSWGRETSVQIVTKDGTIIRSKGKIDKYRVETEGRTDGLELKAFGTSVPEEVSRLLNINEVNLQYQLDSPFLLSNSPGEAAQYFNRVARLDKIDLATQNVNSWIRELNQTIGSEAIKDKPATGLIKQIQDFEEQLKKFDHLPQFEIEVEIIEKLNKKYINLLQQQVKLETFISNFKDINVEIKEKSTILILEKLLDSVLKLIEEKKKLIDKKLDLISDKNNIELIQHKIKQKEQILSIEIPVNNLLKLINDSKTLKARRNLLSHRIEKINNIKLSLTRETTTYESLKAKFEKAMGDVCILCGQTIKK